MVKPKTLVLTGYGINCDIETQEVFERCGSYAKRVHLTDLINETKRLSDFNILALPGGFSFGDDIASGKVLANMLKYNLGEQIDEFIDGGNLIIGICNGFQAMVKMGLLPGFDGDYKKQDVTLTFNDSGKFEDRWVYLKRNPDSKCIYTKGINRIYLPVRHGEGKFVAKNPDVRDRLHKNGHVALTYTNPPQKPAEIKRPVLDTDVKRPELIYSEALAEDVQFPYNPNGSEDNIAGICDETGRVYGMMPHPEAFVCREQHPRWTREELPEEGDGMIIFKNAVTYVKENL